MSEQWHDVATRTGTEPTVLGLALQQGGGFLSIASIIWVVVGGQAANGQNI